MAPVAKARTVQGLSPDLPFKQAAKLTVAVRTKELFAHIDGVLDTSAIEHVHDTRVASRRLRAVLEVYAPCFPRKRHRAALREVKRLADALGARRDPDVQLEALEHFAAGFTTVDRRGVSEFAAVLRDEQEAGNDVVAAALERVAEIDLEGQLMRLAGEPEHREPEHEAA
jgi:CHAD domain-containing protein